MIWVFWAAIILLFVYEIWAVYTREEGDTISEIIWTASVNRPVIPFAFGFLMGHFFW